MSNNRRQKLPHHASHGRLQFNRVQGRKNLNRCPVDQDRFIRLTLCRAEFEQELGREWDFGGDPLFEVDMSHVQFAELLTNMNRGSGTPCTIAGLRDSDGNWQQIEEPPPQPSEAKQTREAFNTAVKEATDSMKRARDEVAVLLESARVSGKKTRAILDAVRFLRLFHDSAPFLMKSFEENVEKVVASAKAEVSAHVDAVIADAGLQALGAKPQLRLKDMSDN